MKRAFSIFILCGLIFFNGCSSHQTPTPALQDMISTAVQETMQTSLGSQDTIATAVQETMQAFPTSTSAPLPVITASPMPETPTITMTPTVFADDILNQLGAPVWEANMQNCNTFGLCTPYEDDYAKISLENGKMMMTIKKGGGYRTWRLSGQKPNNAYIESTISTQNCTQNDNYGLVFRAKDFSSGEAYYLGFNCDGSYKLLLWSGGTASNIIPYTHSDAILAGPNQTNRIGVILKGNEITAYANGKVIARITDNGITESGYIGVFIAGSNASGFTIETSRLACWNIQ